MTTALGRSLESVMKNIDVNSYLPLDHNVPVEPSQFYSSFGYLRHPLTRKPVMELAPYQLDVWHALLEQKRVLAIKSQKVGLSTSQLMADFQLALLPLDHPLSCRGYDELIIAQTKDHAKEHLRTLRKLIIQSRRYARFLIDSSSDIEEYSNDVSLHKLMRTEQTKTSVLFVRNPDDENRPTRLIGLGLDNAGAIQSWKNVKHEHISDPTAAIGDITMAINFAISRLANTEGSIVIETPPSPPVGAIYDLWQKYRAKTALKPGDFKVFEIPASDAIKAGVMSQQWLDSEKERDPINFDRLYGAQFTAHFGNVFTSVMIERAVQLGKEFEEKYGLLPKSFTEKSQGHDPGTSFGTCVVQVIDNVLQVILADENNDRNEDKELYESAARISTWNISTTQIDAAGAAFISSLKRRLGEDPNYEKVDKARYLWMKVKPIPFSTEHRAMLQNMVMLLQNGKVAIAPKFDKLLTAMRTAIAEDFSLDKKTTLYSHVLDAARLALKPFHPVDRRMSQ